MTLEIDNIRYMQNIGNVDAIIMHLYHIGYLKIRYNICDKY